MFVDNLLTHYVIKNESVMLSTKRQHKKHGVNKPVNAVDKPLTGLLTAQ